MPCSPRNYQHNPGVAEKDEGAEGRGKEGEEGEKGEAVGLRRKTVQKTLPTPMSMLAQM